MTEGPRYTAGEVRVRGNKTVPVTQLISRLTKKYPPNDAMVESPTERQGKVEMQWVDENGKNVELLEALWQIGKPAHLLTVPEAGSKLHEMSPRLLQTLAIAGRNSRSTRFPIRRRKRPIWSSIFPTRADAASSRSSK